MEWYWGQWKGSFLPLLLFYSLVSCWNSCSSIWFEGILIMSQYPGYRGICHGIFPFIIVINTTYLCVPSMKKFFKPSHFILKVILWSRWAQILLLHHQETLILDRLSNFSKGSKLVNVGELEFEHRSVLLWSLSSVLYCLPKLFRSHERVLRPLNSPVLSSSSPPQVVPFCLTFPSSPEKGGGGADWSVCNFL